MRGSNTGRVPPRRLGRVERREMRRRAEAPDDLTQAPRFCSACRRFVEEFAPGPGGRPNSRCPLCQALERHRYLALLLAAHAPELRASEFVLEVAPTRIVTRVLRQMCPGKYVGFDIDPNADGRIVQVVGDLTQAPFRDGVFDVSICFHVFEHIPDDRSAMNEYGRLMSPTGIGFVQNPWRPDGPTVEDPTASPEERARRFGQADHVRIYGSDFEERLRSGGIHARRVTPERLLSPDQMTLMGIRSFPIWVVSGPDRAKGHISDARFDRDLRRRIRRLFSDGTWPQALRTKSILRSKPNSASK